MKGGSLLPRRSRVASFLPASAEPFEVVTKLRSGDRKEGTQLLSVRHSGFEIVRFVAPFYHVR
jgi:hypothetical protein